MDSNTYIIARALFMLEQGLIIKEAKRVISELYPEDSMTERTYQRWFSKFREGERPLQDLTRPRILDHHVSIMTQQKIAELG